MVDAIIANPQTIYDSYPIELQTLFTTCPQTKELASVIFEKNQSSASNLLTKLTFCEKQKNEDQPSLQSKVYNFAACLSLFYHDILGINAQLEKYSIERRPQESFFNFMFTYLNEHLFNQETIIDCEKSFTKQDDNFYVFCQAATSYFAAQTLKNLIESCPHTFKSPIPQQANTIKNLGTYFIAAELGKNELFSTSEKMRLFWTNHFKESFCKQTTNHPTCHESIPSPFSQKELAKISLEALCKRIGSSICLEAKAALNELEN